MASFRPNFKKLFNFFSLAVNIKLFNRITIFIYYIYIIYISFHLIIIHNITNFVFCVDIYFARGPRLQDANLQILRCLK